MERITIEVEGMACGMCEAHICTAIRNAYPVKRVRARCLLYFSVAPCHDGGDMVI